MFKLEVPGPEGMVCNFDISQVDGDVSMIFSKVKHCLETKNRSKKALKT